jgi:hypothetical protein
MKPIYLFFILGSLTLFMPSCNKVNQIEEEQASYVVSLNFIGDISMSNETLTKGTATNDLYGINVWYNADKGSEISSVYACGLFDNMDDMTITLLSGYRYKFECTLIKDGKTRIMQDTPGWFLSPFNMQLENTFVMGSRISDIRSSQCAVIDESYSLQTHKLDRYYGELTDYEPTKNGTADINLYRVSFGVKFIITGLVDDGTLSIRCRMWRNSSKETFLSLTTTDNMESETSIFTFPYIDDCWTRKDDYSQDGEVELYYTSNRGPAWDKSFTKDVYWKRNILSTITINVSPDLSNASVSITEETPDEDNEINVGINDNGTIETTE